jgi:hypothetical protein
MSRRRKHARRSPSFWREHPDVWALTVLVTVLLLQSGAGWAASSPWTPLDFRRLIVPSPWVEVPAWQDDIGQALDNLRIHPIAAQTWEDPSCASGPEI